MRKYENSNLAEGNERKTRADRVHFFVMAKSSLTEVDCWVELAYELQYLNNEEYDKCLEFVNKTAYLLIRLTDAQK